MNQAIFAIELYDVSWTFGAFTFENVVIVCLEPPSSSASHLRIILTGRQHVLHELVHVRPFELQQCGSRVHLDAYRYELGRD
jgi:hypothetical protein